MDDHEQARADAADDESVVRADKPKVCANCGQQIDTSDWHPLVTRTEADGTFRVFAFCDATCRDTWATTATTPRDGET